MHQDEKILLRKAIESLILSIEHFNRPWDCGRQDTVLILLDRAFELILKAAIIHKGEKIQRKDKTETIGFDSCVRNAVPLSIISEDQAIILRTINNLRDASQHYVLDISEQNLYLQVMLGFSVFKEILKDIFHEDIIRYLPQRVLPLSAQPPLAITALFEYETEEIRKLLLPGMRKKRLAINKIRALAIIDGAIKTETNQPSRKRLNDIANQIKEQNDWKSIFSGVAAVQITSEQTGTAFSLKITKREGIPVHLVSEGTPGATIVAIKRVNDLDFYNLSSTQLAIKFGLTGPKVLAIVEHFQMKNDQKYFKSFKIGKTIFNRYSQEVFIKIQKDLPTLNMEQVWENYKQKVYGKK